MGVELSHMGVELSHMGEERCGHTWEEELHKAIDLIG